MRSDSFDEPPLIVGIYAITCICGLLDAACFLGLGHVFAEIMTGNLVYLCFAIGDHGSYPIAPPAVALAAFFVGAVAGGRLLRLPGWYRDRRVGFAVEWVALAAAVFATLVLHPTATGSTRYVVFSLLAFAMGIQNAMIRKFGVADLATNVMTLTMTALVAESSLGGGENQRWQRRSASIGIFAVSATSGAVLVRFGVVWPLLLALTVFSVALPILLHPRARRPA